MDRYLLPALLLPRLRLGGVTSTLRAALCPRSSSHPSSQHDAAAHGAEAAEPQTRDGDDPPVTVSLMSSEALQPEAPPQWGGSGQRTRTQGRPLRLHLARETLGGVHVTRLRPLLPAAYLALTMFPALSSTISSNPTAKMSAGLLSSGGQGRRGRKSHPPGPAFAHRRGPCLPVGQVSLCPGARIQTTRQSPTRGAPPPTFHDAHGLSLSASWGA